MAVPEIRVGEIFVHKDNCSFFVVVQEIINEKKVEYSRCDENGTPDPSSATSERRINEFLALYQLCGFRKFTTEDLNEDLN